MRDKLNSFNVKQVCKDKEIMVDGYQKEQKLHFTYESDCGDNMISLPPPV
jgi:hypothetical protein